ncbi:MAG: Ig-like domain-containing protein [Bacteroidota bacterium]
MKKSAIIYTIILAVLIAGCKKDDFREIVVECPVVELANPANAATGVPLNQGISVTFNENMYPESCNAEAPFTLEGVTQVEGTVSYNGKTATFTPSANLLPGTTYTATITEKIKNIAGIPLANEYVWSFTTVDEAGGNVILIEGAQAKKNQIK